MRHLNDNLIQEYLDGNLASADMTLVRAHAMACIDCRQRLQHYQTLYQGLNEDSGYELSGEFAARVTEAAVATGTSRSWPAAVAIGSVAALVLAVLVWWLVDLASLWSACLRLIQSQAEMFTYLKSGAQDLLARLGHEGELIGIGLTVLFTYVVIDRMLLLARRGRTLLTI